MFRDELYLHEVAAELYALTAGLPAAERKQLALLDHLRAGRLRAFVRYPTTWRRMTIVPAISWHDVKPAEFMVRYRRDGEWCTTVFEMPFSLAMAAEREDLLRALWKIVRRKDPRAVAEIACHTDVPGQSEDERWVRWHATIVERLLAISGRVPKTLPVGVSGGEWERFSDWVRNGLGARQHH